MTDNLKQAAEAFRQWRFNRPNRSRTPEHLQLLAVNQLDRYPVTVVCHELGISRKAIKRWQAEQRENVPGFVSLPNESKIDNKGCPSAISLTITMPGDIQCQISGDLDGKFVASLIREMEHAV